jgi:hypothetical protein
MTSAYDIGLYGQGLFDTDDNASNRRAVQELTRSGFTTLVLFTLHVHPSGELYLGDNPIARDGAIVYRWKDVQNPSLPEIVTELRAGGFENILFSIGFGGPPPPEDWQHIQDLLKNGLGQELVANFAAVARWTGVDGFDFDCEEEVEESTIVTMATELARLGRSQVITFCPYDRMQWWLNCLKEIYARHHSQLVRKLNLQAYGGADPGDWLKAVTEEQDGIGVKDPAGLLSIGNQVAPPEQLCQEYTPVGRLGLRAGFLWQFGVFDPTTPPKDYARAVLDGLSGRPCSG